ncbi:MAG: TauD/TfdA family dioxygenase [Ilumatobacter sp.]
MSNAPRTPDFVDHAWTPLVSASLADGFVTVAWADGTTFAAFALWLAENADGFGLEPVVRESTLDPLDLPLADDLAQARVDSDGALVLTWRDRSPVRVHPGWLRHVADGRHLPSSDLPEPSPWTAADFDVPPSVDAAGILDDDDVLERWLTALTRFGICRLVDAPTEPDFVVDLLERVGPIRDTNFGPIWSVRADPTPDSTANTSGDLGQHTDLPTRETPPGFQFLHCIENTVDGGWSRMTDGLAVVDAIRCDHPDAYEALTTLHWVFMNRSPTADHRWIGPIIDQQPGHPLTLRAFYPVRSAAHMPVSDVPRAYESLRVFSRVARDPRFQICTPFRPGDLIAFDNRRVLHGRDAFESGGARHLRGCYADHDDLYSRLRVLRRNNRSATT